MCIYETLRVVTFHVYSYELEKKKYSNAAHLLLLIVVIRTILQIEKNIFYIIILFRYQCSSGTHVNVVSIDK